VGEPVEFWKQPASSRVWDYLAGDKNNFGLDRAVADALTAEFPNLAQTAHATRLFVACAVGLRGPPRIRLLAAMPERHWYRRQV